MVDGLSRLGAFTRILLPLVAPGLVATSVFVFITSWNEYIFALVFVNSPDKKTLPLGLASAIYLSEYASDSMRKWIKPVLELLAGIPTVMLTEKFSPGA